MKSRLRNPLASLLGKEFSWNNPEESIGEFIKMIDGNKSCWKATGRARETFEVLAKDIKTYTDECVDSILGSHWVTWSIYMIGRTPQTAAPVVMFFCEERGPRRKIQDYVKQSGILQKYPGIKTGNATLPPDLEQLEPLASDAISHTNNFNISLSQSKVVVEYSHDNVTSTRVATAGGMVHLNGDAYVFTAGHLFYETSTSGPPREPKIIDDQWDIDSDSHNDNGSDSDTEIDAYDNEFVESTSQASNSCSDDDSSDAPSTQDSPFSDALIQVDDQVISSTQATSSDAVETPPVEDTTPAIDVNILGSKPSFPSSSAATGGHIVVLSADLDYALIKFKNKDFKGNDNDVNLLRPTRVITMSLNDTKIITSTVSGGLMTGTLNGTPSYTRLPNSKTFQKVYTVYINGALVKGDCGSWVIDADDGGLYGHIIAGGGSKGAAYIMSAHKVFEDAKERLGGELLLDCGFATHAVSSIGLLKTAGPIDTRKSIINEGRENLMSSGYWPPNADFIDEDALKHARSSTLDESTHPDLVDEDGLEQMSLGNLYLSIPDLFDEEFPLKNDERLGSRLQPYQEPSTLILNHPAHYSTDPDTSRGVLTQSSSSFYEMDPQVSSRPPQTSHKTNNKKPKQEEEEKLCSDDESVKSESEDSVFSKTTQTRRPHNSYGSSSSMDSGQCHEEIPSHYVSNHGCRDDPDRLLEGIRDEEIEVFHLGSKRRARNMSEFAENETEGRDNRRKISPVDANERPNELYEEFIRLRHEKNKVDAKSKKQKRNLEMTNPITRPGFLDVSLNSRDFASLPNFKWNPFAS